MPTTDADTLNRASRHLAAHTLTFLIEQSRNHVDDVDRLAVIQRAVELIVDDVVDRISDQYGERVAHKFRKGLATE